MHILFLVFTVFMTFIGMSQSPGVPIYPSRSEIINPLHKNSFSNGGTCPQRLQGGNPRLLEDFTLFNGAMDGYRQVDPQIAVGGGFVLHATNNGLIIYDKKGNPVEGASQRCFNDGIDPKMFFDIHNQVFAFDLWWYYDPGKTKPVNISVSETNDPRGAWNTYPVPAPSGVDGGAIGFSRRWIGYSFPGGEENTFVMRTADAKRGLPAKVYHFKGSLGLPVFGQDPDDDLYFLEVGNTEFILRKVYMGERGDPVAMVMYRKPHGLKYIDWPPASAQPGTTQKISSGDRNPKNIVLQNGSIWFSHAVNCEGRSAVQWHQLRLSDGASLQYGLIRDSRSNYIQTSIAVNKNSDVLIGFQQADETRFVSPRFTIHRSSDPPGFTGRILSAGEGEGAADGMSWGDYSGSVIDGDNLSDLWTVQSIANKQGKGETVIIKVPVNLKKRTRKSFWRWLGLW
ncbi:MAG: hypothetical protein ACO25B_05325 [Chitinophagaceae bacterium]